MASVVRSGALALLAAAGLAAAGASAQQPNPQRPAQPPATPAQPAAPVLPGAPWAAPVLPPAGAPSPQPKRQAGPLPESQLKPDPKNLIDCKDAPQAAVVAVPEPLSRWATIYCTKLGHVLTSNERYYSELPGSRGRLRGVLSAAQIGGERKGEIGHGAYFTKIEYAPLAPAEAQKLMAGIDPKILQLVRDKPLLRLALTVDTGDTYQGVVVDPSREVFSVIHVIDGKLARNGFIVATVDHVNKKRMQ